MPTAADGAFREDFLMAMMGDRTPAFRPYREVAMKLTTDTSAEGISELEARGRQL